MSKAYLFAAVALGVFLTQQSAKAATVDWSGRTWQVTSGGMAGVCEGAPANVSVDANGYLHLRISNNGGKWTAAEIFSTERLGFGTYQWHVDGNVDTYDKNVVLGLFPYGPAAGIGDDGTNEIDIEYSRWGNANGPNGDFTGYPASGTTIGEFSFTFTLAGSTLSTSRFVWTSTSITSSLFGGLVGVGSNDGSIKTWTYMPPNPTQNIPQQTLPLGMNLWCFDAPPSDAQPVEIVVRDFTFVEAGTGGAGGAGNAGGVGNAGGSGTAGNTGNAGSSGATGGAGSGGAAGGAGAAAAAGGTGANGGGAVIGAAGSAAGATANAGASSSVGGAGAAAGTSAGRSDAAGAGATATNSASGAGSGCGCSVPGAVGRSDSLELAALVLALAVTRRARARTQSTLKRMPTTAAASVER